MMIDWELIGGKNWDNLIKLNIFFLYFDFSLKDINRSVKICLISCLLFSNYYIHQWIKKFIFSICCIYQILYVSGHRNSVISKTLVSYYTSFNIIF